MGLVLNSFRVLGLMCLAAGALGQVAGLQARNAWVQAAPPQASVQAAYLDLRAEGGKSRILRSVSSPAFARVEIHRTVVSGQMARMEPVPQLAIKAGSVTRFEPGGLHLMLLSPKKPLQQGDTVSLNLQFADGESMVVQAPVRGAAPASEHAGHAH